MLHRGHRGAFTACGGGSPRSSGVVVEDSLDWWADVSVSEVDGSGLVEVDTDEL